ncbi:type III secretion system export apparatus subunit SctT [Enterobacter bugandensis]|uniref:type III secretion system export apparatus subunit SctT n=1 Tax=Enterobacter bugandensis TaxID=881260 RepID=UPI00235F9709|nr:type III secretion system export apparatus subunit SctT [Enterobacter bugandensis]
MMSVMLLDGLHALTVFYLRVLPVFLILPLFQGNWLTHTMIKSCVVVTLGMAFIPAIQPALPGIEHHLVRTALTEVTLGLLIAFPLGLPFWMANMAGQFMDNQRGATISSSLDPNSGVDSSTLATWFNYYCCMLFVAGNGLIHLCDLLRESYSLFPPGEAVDFTLLNVLHFVVLLDLAAVKGIILISPVIITLFLTDVLLAVLSRFTPQLNPFMLSLTIKSLIAFGVLLLYFNPVFSTALQQAIDGRQPLSWFIGQS